MKIHYTAPAWHGGFHTFFSKALRSLGHDVLYFNDMEPDKASRRLRGLANKFTTLGPLFGMSEYTIVDRFRRYISAKWIASVRQCHPDLVIIEHATNVMPWAIKEIRKAGYAVFYWTDSPPAGAQAKDVLESMKVSSRAFSDDAAREWVTTLFAPGDFEFLGLAGDPDVYHPLPSIAKEFDVVFVGSMSPWTGDGVIRAEILSNIPDKYKVGIFGNDVGYWFDDYPRLRARTYSSKALGAEKVNEIYNKAKIVLSIYTVFHIETVSARTHEAALAGAFQIVDYRKGLDVLYPKGLLPRFEYAKEVNELIDHWITRDSEREEIAKKARAHALAYNTWRHRAEEMLKHFTLPPKNK